MPFPTSAKLRELVSYGSLPALYAYSLREAVCSANARYSIGRATVSFSGSEQTVGACGKVAWSWHMESKEGGGTGTVTCTYRGQSKSAAVSFTIG
jgi:hypothetical protein